MSKDVGKISLFDKNIALPTYLPKPLTSPKGRISQNLHYYTDVIYIFTFYIFTILHFYTSTLQSRELNYNVSFSKFAPDLRRRLPGRSERQGQDCGGVPRVRGEDAAGGVR